MKFLTSPRESEGLKVNVGVTNSREFGGGRQIQYANSITVHPVSSRNWISNPPTKQQIKMPLQDYNTYYKYNDVCLLFVPYPFNVTE